MTYPPNPLVRCALCLWTLGFGYDRISRLLFGTKEERHRIYKWRKYHQWPDHPDAFKSYVTAHRRIHPPKPRINQSVEEKERIQQTRFTNKTKRQLRIYLATKINQCLKFGLHPHSTARLVGCSPSHLKSHLESLFQAEMSWTNYGTYWEIDHIKAVHHFNIHDPQQRKTCYHFTNLQPLTKHQNRVKHTKIMASVKGVYMIPPP